MVIPHPKTGEPVDIRRLAKEVGINPRTVERRWHAGDRGERLIRSVNANIAAKRKHQNRDREHLAKMADKVEQKHVKRVRASAHWAMLTTPTLGDFSRHYQATREKHNA